MRGVLSGVPWTWLRTFVAVYRAGSISGGAAELGIAQASASGQIASLERHVGYLLFDRSRSGVSPTNRGRELAALLIGPVEALAAAIGDNPAGGAPGRRTVLLGGPAEFLSALILPGLLETLPQGVHLGVRFGLAHALIEALEEGQLDVLVSPVQPRRPGLTYEPVYDEHFVVVGHPRWQRQAERDIDSIPLLAYDADLQIVRRFWRSVFERRPGKLDAVALVPDLRVLARAAADGAGMTVLPEYLARPYLERGELIALHDPPIPPLNTLYVATRRTVPAAHPAVGLIRSRVAELSLAAKQ